MTDRQRRPPRQAKLTFLLPRDEEDWPPVGEEGLWAEHVEGDVYRIANTPFFAQDIASGDLVEAPADDRGRLVARRKLAASGNCTIRLTVFPDGPLTGDLSRALRLFTPFGIHGQGIEAFSMVALTVPPDSPYGEVKALLRQGCTKGWWDCEEGCITDRWDEQPPPVR